MSAPLELSILFGSLVGMSLGLTGGGGAIFAVPLLVYGLGRDPHEAVGISLASVGLVALVGCVERWRRHHVELRTGLLFAVAGMLTAPLGAWLRSGLEPTLLLALFALVMLVVALRMWRSAGRPRAVALADDSLADLTAGGLANSDANSCSGSHSGSGSDSHSHARSGPACRRDPAGRLQMTTRCTLVLLLAGLVTGLLAGLFGVGGGFVIVPALVLTSGMNIERAIGTSLMVIALISVAGVTAHVLGGQPLPLSVAAPFIAGGMLGLAAGARLARYLAGPALERTFAVAMVLVAIFVIARWQS